jgi:hypothetical protein
MYIHILSSMSSSADCGTVQVVVPIYRLLFGSRVPVVVRTPEDRFRGLEAVGYNFPPNYMNT